MAIIQNCLFANNFAKQQMPNVVGGGPFGGVRVHFQWMTVVRGWSDTTHDMEIDTVSNIGLFVVIRVDGFRGVVEVRHAG